MKVMLGRLMPGFFLSKRGALKSFGSKFSDIGLRDYRHPGYYLSPPLTSLSGPMGAQSSLSELGRDTGELLGHLLSTGVTLSPFFQTKSLSSKLKASPEPPCAPRCPSPSLLHQRHLRIRFRTWPSKARSLRPWHRLDVQPPSWPKLLRDK